MPADLLSQGDSVLPWLPGETLFSLCSRQHRLWGYSLSSRSTEIMFGGKRRGTQHDFPSGLDEFAHRTEGLLGSAVEIARHRTMLRFYRPFLGAADIDHAVWAMRGLAVAHLKFRLGLLTSRFRANHPLKACMACMQADLTEHGWVYWHLVHQFPGVWMCPAHGAPLRISQVKSTGVERFLWSRPAEAQLVDPWPASDVAQRSALLRLSKLTIALVDSDRDDGWLDADAVQNTLRARLRERGWLTAAGNARLTVAAADYLQHCSTLRLPAELAGLPSTLEEAKAQIGRMIRALRSGVHPIRLLVAIDWLFSGPDDFLALHLGTTDVDTIRPANEVTTSASQSASDLARRARLAALLKSGTSASAAAKEIGIDVSTAMAWAAAEGFQVPRRPKVLKAEVRASLLRCLRKGMDKADAAGRHGISIETVTRLLHTEIGLHSAWKVARVTAAQRRARGAWQKLLRDHPGLGVKLLRAMDAASYAWLYRNDRAWLTYRTPAKATSHTNPRQNTVRWDERDLSLSAEVEKAVERLARPGRPLKLWQIYQAVPGLKPKLAVLHRLPLTQQVIERALGRRRAGSVADLLQQEPPLG
ncbi:TnsD family Tn7-like transposition protein [Ideonella sp. A 288]|uniref:TnsD family Tn7-like transposition protein n=1 Tax=Ideonella sp. A 288 TaxID=1962181 RepID=UPI000B4C0534|nr:TnsD family Tn7-like transposition protein [Ideonella sp. A 288]